MGLFIGRQCASAAGFLRLMCECDAGAASALRRAPTRPIRRPARDRATLESTMSLKEKLTEDMKAAMKSGDKDRLGVIRLINAAIKQREVDERIQLDDAQVLAAIEKMLKQRRDSITQFRAAGREDLAGKEEFEVGVIQGYLPAQLSEAEIDAIVTAAVAESGAASAKDMGKVVGLVKAKVAGRADMGQVSALIKRKLGG
jgi:uncharacterized protein YqeY